MQSPVTLMGVPPVALMGLGISPDLAAEVDGFLLRTPRPTSTEVAEFLKLYSGADREAVGRGLVAAGVPASTVGASLRWLDTSSKITPSVVWGVLGLASGALGAYHGYRRNDSIGWSVVWFGAGMIFPIFTPVLALAQGFGKRKGSHRGA